MAAARSPYAPRVGKAEASRRAIIEAAVTTIARRGLGGLTFRSLADEAGISTTPITYHFGSLNHLIHEVARFTWETVWGPIDSTDVVAVDCADPLDLLRSSVERMLPLRGPVPDSLRVYAELMYQNSSHPAIVRSQTEIERWTASVRRRHYALLEAASSQGAVPDLCDSEGLMDQVYALASGLLARQLAYPGVYTRQSTRRLWRAGFASIILQTAHLHEDVPTPVHETELVGSGGQTPIGADRILDAAVRIIARDGLAGLTIRSVARELGTSTAPITYAFDSKAGLIHAIARRVYFAVWDAAMPPIAGQLGDAPLEQVRDIYERTLPVGDAIDPHLLCYAELFMQNSLRPELELARRDVLKWSKTTHASVLALLDRERALHGEPAAGSTTDLADLLVAVSYGLRLSGLYWPRIVSSQRTLSAWRRSFQALTATTHAGGR